MYRGAVLAVVGVAAVVLAAARAPRAQADDAVIVVELFSSEGCSSCPPADRLLRDIDQAQPVRGVRIVTLEEHVDYWNYLGWQDPFSSAEFSRREEAYARTVPGVQYATPQIVADGRIAVEPSPFGVASAVMQAASRRKIPTRVQAKVDAAGRGIQLTASAVPAAGTRGHLRAAIAITEDGLKTQVTDGENEGRQLSHSAVVRRWIDLGPVEAGKAFQAARTTGLDPAWKRDQLTIVAIVQDADSGAIVGAAASGLG